MHAISITQGAILDGLTSSAGTLTPALDPSTTSYSVSVPNSPSTITFTPDYSATTTTGVLAGTPVTELTQSHALNLPDGTNTFSWVLTDADTTNTTYTLTVIRAPALTGFVLASGALSPAFNTNTLSYGTSVANSVASLAITATSEPANGVTLTVGGTAVASGVASSGVALSEGTTAQGGNTTIPVVVTNAAGSVTYNVLVHRGPSANAYISDVFVGSGTLTRSPSGTPGWFFQNYAYTVDVGNGIANMVFRLLLIHPGATVTVGGHSYPTITSADTGGAAPAQDSTPIALNEGSTTAIPLVVTAQDGVTSLTYTVTVSRDPSTDALLSSITLSNGTLVPSFASGSFIYNATVDNSIAAVTLAANFNHPLASSLKVNTITVAEGAPSPPHSMAEGGSVVITVKTVAQDATTEGTYVVEVHRNPSGVSTLSALTVNTGTMAPAFDPAVISYTMDFPFATSEVIFTPTKTHTLSSIQAGRLATTQKPEQALESVNSGSQTNGFILTEGLQNTVNIIVLAQDGTSTTTYTILITRGPSSVLTMTSLRPTDGVADFGPFSPTFADVTTAYECTVANHITAITFQFQAFHFGVTMSVPAAASQLIEGEAVTFDITMSAQDQINKKNYTITVHRTPSAINTISQFSYYIDYEPTPPLTPAFSFDRYNYTMYVPFEVTSIIFSATVVHPKSQLTIGGLYAPSGGNSSAVPLSSGVVNQVEVVSTAQNIFSKKRYIVYIYRTQHLNQTCAFIRFGWNGHTSSPFGLYTAQNTPAWYLNGKQWYREVNGLHFLYFDNTHYANVNTTGGSWVIASSPNNLMQYNPSDPLDIRNSPEPTTLPTDAGPPTILYYNSGTEATPYDVDPVNHKWLGHNPNASEAGYPDPDPLVARVFCTLDILTEQQV